MRRRGGAGDVGAGAETGIDHAERLEPVERRAVIGEMLGLAAHLAVPIETEPGQILDDAGDELVAASRLVDVFDPQQELSAGVARPPPREQRGIGVAEMQPPGRARREPRDDQFSADSATSAWYCASGSKPLSYTTARRLILPSRSSSISVLPRFIGNDASARHS